MAEIDVRLQINAAPEKIWNIISKVDNDPNYWKGIKSIRNISKKRNVIYRETTLANNKISYQKITLFPKEGIHTRLMNGPIVGIRDILLINNGNATILEFQLTYTQSGLTRMAPKNILKELQLEAELALQLIKEEVEKSFQPSKENKKLRMDIVNG